MGASGGFCCFEPWVHLTLECVRNHETARADALYIGTPLTTLDNNSGICGLNLAS